MTRPSPNLVHAKAGNRGAVDVDLALPGHVNVVGGMSLKGVGCIDKNE